MRSIITQWSRLNLAAGAPTDYTMLFSDYIDLGWELIQISTAVDRYGEERIIIVTALLEKLD